MLRRLLSLLSLQFWEFGIASLAILAIRKIPQPGRMVGLFHPDQACWQPSQPIFTTCLAAFLGYEELSPRKLLGVLVAASGAVFMVLWGAKAATGASISGQFCLFINCFSTSCYFIVTKDLLYKHDPVFVTGCSYMVAGILMLVVFLITNSTPVMLNFVCSDPQPLVQQACIQGSWTVPASMMWPLAYWILFNSILCYLCVTWANKHAKASAVSAYAVLQPLTAAIISATLRFSKGQDWADTYGFGPLGTNDLGVLGIILGLFLLFSDPAGSMQTVGSRREAAVDREARSEAELAGLVEDVLPIGRALGGKLK